MTSPHDSPDLSGDDDQNARLEHINANPPYSSTFPQNVAAFRDLLAELIARQILTERRAPKDSDNETDS